MDCEVKKSVLVILTGGIMDDGVTSWMIKSFSAINHNDIHFETVAWPETDLHIIEKVERCGFKVRYLPSRKRSFISYCRSLFILYMEQNYDIVHVCGSSGITAVELVLAKISGVKKRIVHSHNTMCSHRILDKLLRPIMLSSATILLACGQESGQWLFGDRKFTVIHNGNDLSNYRFCDQTRNKYRKQLNISDEQIAIGHVGRFNRQKNQARLLEIFSELHRCSSRYIMFFIGSGKLELDIQEYAKTLGVIDSVRFLGSRDDVPEILDAMDCMVFPSLYEGFPNVIIEWQANGLPCLVSSSVTKECQITDLVHFCSLEESNTNWAKYIKKITGAYVGYNRFEFSQHAYDKLKSNGFCIKECTEKLYQIYID